MPRHHPAKAGKPVKKPESSDTGGRAGTVQEQTNVLGRRQTPVHPARTETRVFGQRRKSLHPPWRKPAPSGADGNQSNPRGRKPAPSGIGGNPCTALAETNVFGHRWKPEQLVRTETSTFGSWRKPVQPARPEPTVFGQRRTTTPGDLIVLPRSVNLPSATRLSRNPRLRTKVKRLAVPYP